MDFQVIKEREYDNIVKNLFDSVPEFRESYKDEVETDPYLVFGALSRFLIMNINSNNQPLIKKVFHFINENYCTPDIEVANLFEVQIFEVLFESEDIIKLSIGNLTGEALENFLLMKARIDSISGSV